MKVKLLRKNLLNRLYRFVKNVVLYFVLRPKTGYRLFLKRKYGVVKPLAYPKISWENKVLRTQEEWVTVSEQVAKLQLPSCSDKSKNWDTLAALNCILKRTGQDAHILDAGAELYSMLLPWLFLYGYKNLTGINLLFNIPVKRGVIRYKHGNIIKTNFKDAFFDAVSCLSVIEHGVNLKLYFNEMFRILKPGGVLVTSTDYYEFPIDTGNRQAYGAPVHIFCKEEITG